MNPLKALKRILTKKPTYTNMFKEGDKITLLDQGGARMAHIEGVTELGLGDYCTITVDSWLFYESETIDRAFFKVSTNWLPRFNTREVPNGTIVYIEKEVLKKMHYGLHRWGRNIEHNKHN